MIAPSTQDLERDVREYVAKGSGMEPGKVIPGQTSGPAPSNAYATVLLISELPDGFVWTRNEGVDRDGSPGIDATVYESLTLSYSVQWFRTGARDLARTFRLWAQSPAGILNAERRGLTFYRTSEVRQIDDIVSEEWEERAGLDLYLGIVATNVQDVGLAATFDVTIHHDGNDPVTTQVDGVNRPCRAWE